MITAAHSSCFAGHGGIAKTLMRIKPFYWWKGISNAVRQFVLNCEICRKAKSKVPSKAPLMSMPNPEGPNKRVHMDLFGELRSDGVGKYILVITDAWSKFTKCCILRNKTADAVAEAFITEWISLFGPPLEICTDQGKEFINKTLTAICERLQIGKLRTTAFKPSTNSSAESFNRNIIKFFKCKLEDTLQWERELPLLSLAYNTSFHRTIGTTPFKAMMGFEPNLAPFQFKMTTLDRVESEEVSRFRENWRLFDKINESIESATKAQEDYFNKKTKQREFKVGDSVYLQKYNLVKRVGINNKLSKNYEGPFRVIEVKSRVNVVIQEKPSGKQQVVHINRLLHACGNDLSVKGFKKVKFNIDDVGEREQRNFPQRASDVIRPPIGSVFDINGNDGADEANISVDDSVDDSPHVVHNISSDSADNSFDTSNHSESNPSSPVTNSPIANNSPTSNSSPVANSDRTLDGIRAFREPSGQSRDSPVRRAAASIAGGFNRLAENFDSNSRSLRSRVTLPDRQPNEYITPRVPIERRRK